MKPKPAQEHWYRVAICLHEFGQRLVAPRLQILEIFWVIGTYLSQKVKWFHWAGISTSTSDFSWVKT